MTKIRNALVVLVLMFGATATFASAAEAGVPSCPSWEPLLAQYSPGWNVARMSAYTGRESGCVATAVNRRSGAAGLLQITSVNYRYLSRVLGEPVNRQTLMDPDVNIRAAAALWTYWAQHGSAYRPWR